MGGTGGTRAALTRRDAAIIVGCVPFWLSPRAASLMLLRYQSGPAALEPAEMLAWYALFALAVIAMSAFAVKAPGTALGRPCVVLTGVGGGVATAGMLSGRLAGAALGGALALLAAYAVVHLNGIARLVVREPLSKVPLLVVCSAALVNGVRAAVGGLDASLAQAAFPLLSAAFLAVMKPSSRVGRTASPLKSLAQISWPIVLACACLIALWSFTLGTLSQNQNWTLTDSQKRLSYALTCLLLFIMTAAFAACLRRGQAAAMSPVLYLFTAIALLYMLVLLGMCMSPEVGFVRFKQLLISIEQCLEVLLLALLLADIARRRLSPAPALAVCVIALTNSPWLVASNVISTAFGPASSTLASLPVALSFATAVVLVACLLASIRRVQALRADVGRDAQRELCERAAEAYDLSRKELEVLDLLYRGNSAKRVAQTLGVTESTVHSHTSSIYRKLGIHSRQEAIDCVDSYRAGL